MTQVPGLSDERCERWKGWGHLSQCQRSHRIRHMRGVPGPARSLCAVLASPPLTSGVRTLRMLERGAEALGCSEVRHVNLFAHATRDLRDLTRKGVNEQGWLDARASIEMTLSRGGVLLFAWGTVEPNGRARQHLRDQVRWLIDTAWTAGHAESVSLGGSARHPSRWHQYVSDRHDRVGTGSVEARLQRAFLRTPIVR